METQKAYLVGTDSYSFRSGEPAEIIGVVMVSVREELRPCYHVNYSDGVKDFVAICDSANFVILPATRIKRGRVI